MIFEHTFVKKLVLEAFTVFIIQLIQGHNINLLTIFY